MTTSCMRNMSPHFYLVYFLIFIKLSICYDYYVRDVNEKHDAKKSPKINHNQGRSAKLGNNPNAQLDLADFLNVADEIGGGNHDYDVNSENNSKDYNVYGSLMDKGIEKIKKRDDTSDFFNGAYNPVDSNRNTIDIKNVVNGGQMNTEDITFNQKLVNNRNDKVVTMKLYDESIDRSLIHHPEKKCSFKNMKFPFFSHNKNQTNRKAKKRKMFCLNCKKESLATTSTAAYDMRNKNKRSYVEMLCPECKRKFRVEVKADMDDEKRRLNQRMIHNSRQYFAEIDNQAKEKLEQKRFTIKEDFSTDIDISFQNPRRKRENLDDRDRKLQELDVIQKKVDSLELNMPHFEKPVEM